MGQEASWDAFQGRWYWKWEGRLEEGRAGLQQTVVNHGTHLFFPLKFIAINHCRFSKDPTITSWPRTLAVAGIRDSPPCACPRKQHLFPPPLCYPVGHRAVWRLVVCFWQDAWAHSPQIPNRVPGYRELSTHISEVEERADWQKDRLPWKATLDPLYWHKQDGDLHSGVTKLWVTTTAPSKGKRHHWPCGRCYTYTSSLTTQRNTAR